MNALLAMIHDVPGATADNEPVWDNLLDAEWLHRLSTGEQARVWLGFQLYNGSTLFTLREFNLHNAVSHLDAEGRGSFLAALSYLMPVGR